MTTELQPVLLEVLARVPTDFLHCSHCEQLFGVAGIGGTVHREVRTSYPPEFLEEAERLTSWLWTLSSRYGQHLRIRVVDVHSIEGFFKSLRYGLFRYPAFIIDHHATHIGWDRGPLDSLLDACVAEAASREEK